MQDKEVFANLFKQAINDENIDLLRQLKQQYVDAGNPIYNLLLKRSPDDSQDVLDCLFEDVDLSQRYEEDLLLHVVLRNYKPAYRGCVTLLLQKYKEAKLSRHINKKGHMGMTPLYLAVKTGDQELVKHLLEEGAMDDVSVNNLQDLVERAEYKIDTFGDGRLLYQGNESKNKREIDFFDPDRQPSALARAVYGNNAEMIKLLSKTCDVNAAIGQYQSIGLLELAAVKGYKEAVTALLDCGAKLGAAEAMFWAALSGNKAMLKAILDSGHVSDGIEHAFPYIDKPLTEEDYSPKMCVQTSSVYNKQTVLTSAISVIDADGEVAKFMLNPDKDDRHVDRTMLLSQKKAAAILMLLRDFKASFFVKPVKDLQRPIEAVMALSQVKRAIFLGAIYARPEVPQETLCTIWKKLKLPYEAFPFCDVIKQQSWDVLNLLQRVQPMDNTDRQYAFRTAMFAGNMDVAKQYATAEKRSMWKRFKYTFFWLVTKLYHFCWTVFRKNPKGNWTKSYKLVLNDTAYQLHHSQAAVGLEKAQGDTLEVPLSQQESLWFKQNVTQTEFENEMLKKGIDFSYA